MATHNKRPNRFSEIKSSLITVQIYNVLLAYVSHDISWPWYEVFGPLLILGAIYAIVFFLIGIGTVAGRVEKEKKAEALQEAARQQAAGIRVVKGRIVRDR